MPASGHRIAAAIRAADPDASIADCDDLEEAVAVAFAWAAPRRATVLLSPGAPSFGRFADYTERADAFAAAIRALGGDVGRS